VIVALPGPAAVTSPVALTVAAAGLLELQVTSRPVSTVPFASFVTAVSCRVGVIPTTRLAELGVTVTVATGAGVTVSAALPVLVSLVAMILAVPADTAVTSPLGETVATDVLLELHAIGRPLITRPCASSVVAVA
jgi:hypothetical protein